MRRCASAAKVPCRTESTYDCVWTRRKSSHEIGAGTWRSAGGQNAVSDEALAEQPVFGHREAMVFGQRQDEGV